MSANSLTQESFEDLVRWSCHELARRLRDEEDCRAEDFFREHPELAERAETAVELIYTEFVIRRGLGHEAELAAWEARFPAWKDELRRFVASGGNGASVNEAKPNGALGSSYEILGEIGRGGMGIVYRARQRRLGRTVAIKRIAGGSSATTEERRRLQREAEAIARLHHPNIVQIFEVGDTRRRALYCGWILTIEFATRARSTSA